LTNVAYTHISITMFNSNLQLQHTTKVTLYYLVVLTYHVNTMNMPRKNKRMEAMSILCDIGLCDIEPRILN